MHVSLPTIRRVLIAVTMAMATLVGRANAQTPVHWSVKVAPTGSVTPGATLTATATAEIDGGWHIYALTQGPGGPHALEVSVQKSPVFSLGGRGRRQRCAWRH